MAQLFDYYGNAYKKSKIGAQNKTQEALCPLLVF